MAAVLRADAGEAFRVRIGNRLQVRKFKGRNRLQMARGYAASTDDSDSVHLILDSEGQKYKKAFSMPASSGVIPYGFCAPFVSTYTENSDCEQVMNSRFFFAPPKQRLAQGAGRWILPIKVPSGAKQCTPS